MHYIRLLRPPRLAINRNRYQTELVFDIKTDLGDSLLCPDSPIDLVVTAHVFSPMRPDSSCLLSEPGKLQWQANARVLKPVFEFPQMIRNALQSGDTVELCISPASSLSADEVRSILSSSIKSSKRDDMEGLIMPVWVGLNGPEADVDISTRRIRLNKASETAEYLEIEEDIGESIARHIWDAGVVSLCAIAGTYKFPELASSQGGCMQKVNQILGHEDGVNVLELGCGVGVLGIGLCAVYPRGVSECTILMTDLPEAEGRARANMGLLQQQRSGSNLGYAQVMYENLDWEHGRRGSFGQQTGYRRWDLVMLSDCTYNVDMLPALVETLSALHRHNKEQTPVNEQFSTKVFLATKPRHASELALFQLMAAEEWKVAEKQVLPLPVVGREMETVEMYLFEKTA